MKVTSTRFAHNMYRWRKWQLFMTSRRKVKFHPVYQKMRALDVPLVNANDVVKERVHYGGKVLQTVGIRKPPPKMNEIHPYWNDKPCLFHRDNNVLVQGFDQAKVFTNSVEIKKGLPEQIEWLLDQNAIHQHNELIHMALASAIVYDATQNLLPKRKDPERPAWIFNREYGINDKRRNYVLCNRFLHLCELIAGPHISQDRYKFEEAYFSVPLFRDEDIIQLQMRADLLLLSKKSLKPVCESEVTLKTSLPDLTPLDYKVSLTEENIYKLENVFPIEKKSCFPYVHTVIIHFNETEVQNLYKTPILESQTVGRSLMKAFTIAAAQARYLYGDDIEILPKPVVVQCVQTDAKYFHFSVFQLNTLIWPPSSSAIRNIFWSDSIIPAYEFGGYFEAQPTITSYNSEVFKKFLAFYMNQ